MRFNKWLSGNHGMKIAEFLLYSLQSLLIVFVQFLVELAVIIYSLKKLLNFILHVFFFDSQISALILKGYPFALDVLILPFKA